MAWDMRGFGGSAEVFLDGDQAEVSATENPADHKQA